MGSFDILEHDFTKIIVRVLKEHFKIAATDILASSPLLGYLNYKTKAANRGSKSRASFANLYALYVVVEDYIQKGYLCETANAPYTKYEGARFSDLLQRQRQLPFGAKLQNHALNSRLNDEFRKLYPNVGKFPIVRDVETQRYWIQDDLLLVDIRDKEGQDITYNVAQAIIDIIDKYVDAKREAFDKFLKTCKRLAKLGKKNPTKAIDFVKEQLAPNADARVFEIVSYAVLKEKYGRETIWIGQNRKDVMEEYLMLYKTGRTNANDGGIDFVMRPLGRFFQVTETVDASKYFLDIDKIQKFPITFIVKSTQTSDEIKDEIRSSAKRKYKIEAVVCSYMDAIEEIINVEDLLYAFGEIVASGELENLMDEIIKQSKVEFNY